MFNPWNLSLLRQAPSCSPAPDFAEDGVQAIFYDGLPWHGRSTRVFAWVGMPRGVTAPVPGMVLVHGGGGTAFAEWVRLWTGRGYAAIAMDTCGCVPAGSYGDWQRHANGGPAGWDACFAQIEEPVTDQWPFHAVADVMLAHALLASFPEVDAARIGLTGISWGGFLTCLTAGADPRFRFAAPVYGCGFLGEDSVWLPNFAEMGPDRAGRWLAQWDPSVHLPRAAMPLLWVTGTNDFAYPMGSLRKSYRLPAGPRTLCIRVNMPHGHGGAGENPEEIHAFAAHHLADGPGLPIITGQNTAGHDAWVSYRSPTPITRAELHYTRDRGPWQPRAWHTEEAYLDTTHTTAHAAVPTDATAYYLNLTDTRHLVVSSEHVELTP